MGHDSDPDLEDSNLIVLHDTPSYDDVSPCQGWLQKAQQFRRYADCDLDIKQSTPIFSLDTLAFDALLPKLVGPHSGLDCKDSPFCAWHSSL